MKHLSLFVILFLILFPAVTGNAWETKEMQKLAALWYWKKQECYLHFFKSVAKSERDFQSGEGSLAALEEELRSFSKYAENKDIIENEIVALRQLNSSRQNALVAKKQNEERLARERGISIEMFRALKVVFGTEAEKWEVINELEKDSRDSTKDLHDRDRLELHVNWAMEAIGIKEERQREPDKAKLAYWEAIYAGETSDSATKREANALLREMKDELQKTREELDSLRRTVDDKEP